VYAQEVAAAHQLDAKVRQMLRTDQMYVALLPDSTTLPALSLEYDEAWELR
jgi:hypothetical protein